MLTGIVFFVTIIVLFVPLFPFSFGATNASFTVTLTIGNNNPFITWVEPSLQVTPSIGTYTTVFVSFNATDIDGYQNLNNATAQVVLTFGSEQTRTSSYCNVNATDTNTTQFNCSITIWYYDLPDNWQINAFILDINSGFANDTSETIAIQTLTAVQLNKSSMSFTANLGQENVSANENPIIIDNLGNVNITEVNLTAFDLNKSAEYILATNFSANSTDNSTQHNLVNETGVTLVNVAVPRDLPAFADNESMYLWVNVPAAGITAGQFQSIADWVVDVS